jgi:hypothetical protein
MQRILALLSAFGVGSECFMKDLFAMNQLKKNPRVLMLRAISEKYRGTCYYSLNGNKLIVLIVKAMGYPSWRIPA